jgi:hypothetical protein
MFERIKYRYRLCKLKRSEKRTKKIYDSHIKKAQNDDEKQSVISEAMFFIGEEDLKIRKLHTDYLRQVANNLIVPLPEFKDESIWENVNSLGIMYILTPKGVYELKRLIRNEKKEKREVIFNWITLLIGLLGAIIGVISVLR